MKQTPFTSLFINLGAKMIPFVGYSMPLYIDGITKEHLAVRNQVGVFDVSYMGKIFVKGQYAKKFTQQLSCNDIYTLTPGKTQYNCMLNREGGILDDMLIYQLSNIEYLLVVNAVNTQKIINSCLVLSHKKGYAGNIQIDNQTEFICQLAIQGPSAMKVIQNLTSIPVVDMKPFTFQTISIGSVENVILSITGYTGSSGCELYLEAKSGQKLWQEILEAGKEHNITPCGLGARDILRLEAGMMLYNNDINENTTPIEAGLSWLVKWNDNNNFIGKSALKKQKDEGITKRLIGFEMIGEGIPRKGYIIENSNGKVIGKVTSGTISSFLNKKIGMGYIQPLYNQMGNHIYLLIRNKKHKAKVVKLPFYKPKKK